MGSANLLMIVGLLIAMMMSSVLIVPAPVSAAAGSRKELIGRPHHHRQKTKTRSSKSSEVGFRVELRHVDHGRNFSKFERLQRAVIRGKHRLQKLSMMGLAAATTGDTTAIKSPIHPGKGEFLMKIAIGTPPLPYSAILDTGSDLIWTQCQPCLQCYDQPSPIFNPSNSSSFRRLPCSSSLCSALPTPSCSSSSSSCSYSYGYGDDSSTSGTLATDTFSFDDSVSIPNVAFGCGDDNEGSGFDQGGGLVGLGRGPLSLVSQLDEPKFSYCLTAATSSSSSKSTACTLLMGSLADVTARRNSDTAVRTTPLAKNPAQPSFYYLNLDGISVGGARVPIPKSTFAINDDGTGGVIIDSGTTITYLEEKAFEAVKKQFVKKTKLAVSEDGAERTGLELCFESPAGTEEVEVPALVFHFEKADLELPAENYMVADEEDGVVCLAMGSASGMSIFGNIQQQNMVVLHDLTKETISFVGAKCEDL